MHRRYKEVMKAIALMVVLVIMASLMIVGIGFILTKFIFRPLLSILILFVSVMAL